MEYVVPLLIVLVIVLIVLLGARLVGRRRRQDGAAAFQDPAGAAVKSSATADSPARRSGRGVEITREDAESASARLDPETHRRVYSLIAQRQVVHAVKEYRQATRTGLREAAASVAALAQFPQPTPERPAQKPAEGVAPSTGADAVSAPEPKRPAADASFTVEDILAAGVSQESTSAMPQPVAIPTSYRYRAIVSQGEEVREVVSTRLNAEIFNSITELALSGNYDGAASLLRNHADIGSREAMEFVRMISPEA